MEGHLQIVTTRWYHWPFLSWLTAGRDGWREASAPLNEDVHMPSPDGLVVEVGPVWAGKPAAVMPAAAGRAGGERAQYMLRHFLVPHGAEVVHGPEVLVGSNFDQFDGDRLINEINLKALTELMGKLREAADL